MTRHPLRNRRTDRRGLSAGILLVAMTLIVAVVGLAFNVARLSLAERQLRGGCEAAALAGAAELLDEHVLMGTEYPADDALAARYVAQLYAARNGIDQRPVVLDFNPANDPRGDLVVGWVDNPSDLRSPLRPWTGAGPINCLEVTAPAIRARGTALPLWAGRMLGLAEADVVVRARATLDPRLVGFRPEPHVKVPVLPLVVTAEVWHAQAAASAGSENDRYTVDPATGRILTGADGVVEVTLFVPQDPMPDDQTAPDVMAAAFAPPAGWSLEAFATQLREGLSQADLARLGGELLATRDAPLEVPAATVPLDAWTAVLPGVAGVNRVWPVGQTASGEATNPGTAQITEFVAGRLVDIRWRTGDKPGLELIVQPSVLASSSAVVAPGHEPNPWIAKLQLTR